MRNTRFFVVASGLAVAGALVLASGCEQISNVRLDCEAGTLCDAFKDREKFDGGAPPECKGTSESNTIFFSETCGVYVSPSGNDSDSGTKKNPFKTINAAIAGAYNAKKTRVYACAKDFDGQVAIGTDIAVIELYGGFDCDNDWAKSMLPTTINGPEIGVLVNTPGSVLIEDFSIISKNNGAPGGSSIALMVSQATLTYNRGTLIADNGVDGTSPDPLAADFDLNGIDGVDGDSLCTGGSSHAGGASKTKDCSMTGGESKSGKGGDGGAFNGSTPADGGNGENGAPTTAMNFGKGEGTMTCANGKPGAPGIKGKTGLAGNALGGLTISGYQGTPGGDGEKGFPGQGGGGGGGTKGVSGVTACGSSSAKSFVGTAGGSGTTGGCGGRGGKGGGAGGSSIALASLNATQVTLTDVLFSIGKGGNGGNGAAGQNGGAPGFKVGKGGLPDGIFGKLGCDGGLGGAGGNGGGGGGGRGGHALGIAFTGTKPVAEFKLANTAQPGQGGKAGDGDPQGDGDPGIGIETQKF